MKENTMELFDYRFKNDSNVAIYLLKEEVDVLQRFSYEPYGVDHDGELMVKVNLSDEDLNHYIRINRLIEPDYIHARGLRFHQEPLMFYTSMDVDPSPDWLSWRNTFSVMSDELSDFETEAAQDISSGKYSGEENEAAYEEVLSELERRFDKMEAHIRAQPPL